MAEELFSKAELAKILNSSTSNAVLTKLATQKSSLLCEKIQEATSLINSVKGQAKDVADSKKSGSNLFDLVGKVAGLAATGTQAANSSAQLNNLVQNAISAFTSSSQFAGIMQGVLKNILKNGFTDSSGQNQTLTSASSSSVNTILNAVTSFLKTSK